MVRLIRQCYYYYKNNNLNKLNCLLKMAPLDQQGNRREEWSVDIECYSSGYRSVPIKEDLSDCAYMISLLY